MVNELLVVGVASLVDDGSVGVVDDRHEDVHGDEDDEGDEGEKEELRHHATVQLNKGALEVDHAQGHGEEGLDSRQEGLEALLCLGEHQDPREGVGHEDDAKDQLKGHHGAHHFSHGRRHHSNMAVEGQKAKHLQDAQE